MCEDVKQMSVSVAVDKFVEITPQDQEWNQTDPDNNTYPRAIIEISDDCPYAVRHMLEDAQTRGYLKVKAYVPEAQVLLEMVCEQSEVEIKE